MIRTDERLSTAPPETLFQTAADVERWPEILPHYRWVRFHEKRGFGVGVVEMAAWRDFLGPIRYPTWWASEMEADPDTPIVRYRHVDGITRRMDVRWEFLPGPQGTLVRVVHEWDGPAWPVIGRFAAEHVIGPHFVSAIARRTLAGVCARAEQLARTSGARPPEGVDHA
jgi:ribosome-associated toxin RatA of RatAB toxin-antitoxin module